MYKVLALFLFICLFSGIRQVYAQDLKTTVNENKELDSLRNKLENSQDSVVFTSRFVRFTTLRLTKDSIQTLPLDTSLRGIQNYSPIVQPRRPTINTGNIGLAAKDMLFQPNKTIGFDPGFHSLDWYATGHDDIIYYQARTAFTNLYYAGLYSGDTEQIFKVTHSQNIKKNWNMGASYGRIGANGNYIRQRGDVLNATLFSWYTSPNKRYTLFANAIFNTLKAFENGSIRNDSIFGGQTLSIDRGAQSVRLNNSGQLYRKNTILLKQSYFVGRIDTLDQEISKKVLPTNKITYSLRYDKDSYAFQKSESDDHTVLPDGINDLVFTNDSVSNQHIQNEFVYSFFLRGKSTSVIKNELKIDAGIRHDYYSYSQRLGNADGTDFYRFQKAFQNVTLLGNAGYRFSNRVDLNFDVQQIAQGRQAGDYLYEAKSNVLVSNNIGRIVLGAYMQNKSPEEIFERYYGNHYQWLNGDADGLSEADRRRFPTINGKFNNTKTVNLSFKYINDKLKLDAGAEYYRINDYLYFRQTDPLADSTTVTPMQEGGTINILKLTLGKKFSYGRFNLESYVVYQNTSNQSVMPTPEFYTFNSLYVDQTIFKVLRTNFGIDVRYNTKFANYAYNPAISQFYIGRGVELPTTPIVDFWIRASLRKANIFLKYEYANQGLGQKGYYTVYRYPMPDRIFKFGLSWNFYD